MKWILEHFQIVVVIALAVASWLKHRADLRKSEQAESQPPGEMADGEEVFGPEDEWRIPQEQTLPPAPPPLRVDMSEIDALLKRQQDMQERLRQIKQTKATTTGGASATRTRVAASQSHAKPLVPGKAGLRASLRDPKQTRRAIVLREILGPPPGLR
jgi:hypothetical protein